MTWCMLETWSAQSSSRTFRVGLNHPTFHSRSFSKPPFGRIESLRSLRFRVPLGQGTSAAVEFFRV